MPLENPHERVIPSHLSGLAGLIAGLDHSKRSRTTKDPGRVERLVEELKDLFGRHLDDWDKT